MDELCLGFKHCREPEMGGIQDARLEASSLGLRRRDLWAWFYSYF